MTEGTRKVADLQEIADHFQSQIDHHYESIIQQKIALNLLCQCIGDAGGSIADLFDEALSDFISQGEPQLKNLNLLQDVLNSLRGDPDASFEEAQGPRLRLVVEDFEE